MFYIFLNPSLVYFRVVQFKFTLDSGPDAIDAVSMVGENKERVSASKKLQ